MASAEATEAAVASLGGYAKGLYAEKWVPFVCELAVMVVRSRDGTVASFPVVQTIHKNNICSTTEAPAQVPADAGTGVFSLRNPAGASVDSPTFTVTPLAARTALLDQALVRGANGRAMAFPAFSRSQQYSGSYPKARCSTPTTPSRPGSPCT